MQLQMIFMEAGYESSRAYQIASTSMYYQISQENYEAYLNLHITLLAQCNEGGFEETKAHIQYHACKLREPRGIYSVRLQMIAHHYIYLRDRMKCKWESLGIQKLRFKALRNQGALGISSDGAARNSTSLVRPCTHCHSRFHQGNKKNCFWKDLSPSEAKKAAKECAKNLGVGVVTQQEA